MNNRSLTVAAAAGLILVSCGGVGSTGPAVEVGTGEKAYEIISAGNPVGIVCGAQGGQHIWTAIRARNMDPSSVNIRITIRLASAAEPFCGFQLQGIQLGASTDGWFDFVGSRCFVYHPDQVVGQDLIMEGVVTDSAGHTATGASVPFRANGPPVDCATGKAP